MTARILKRRGGGGGGGYYNADGVTLKVKHETFQIYDNYEDQYSIIIIENVLKIFWKCIANVLQIYCRYIANIL